MTKGMATRLREHCCRAADLTRRIGLPLVCNQYALSMLTYALTYADCGSTAAELQIRRVPIVCLKRSA
jgi:hypothetical protein